jgi:hypothetical protein
VAPAIRAVIPERQLKLTIEDVLDSGLPRIYTLELYRQKCSALFEHVYESYPQRDAGVYVHRFHVWSPRLKGPPWRQSFEGKSASAWAHRHSDCNCSQHPKGEKMTLGNRLCRRFSVFSYYWLSQIWVVFWHSSQNYITKSFINAAQGGVCTR